MGAKFESAEETLRKLQFGESVSDQSGNKYTKTIGGWIYSTYSGQLCFIPERMEEGATVRKNRTTEK